MANPARLRRVAEQIRRELSEILHAELKDPGVGMITVTDVEVSPDFAHAKVFFTTLGDAAKSRGIDHASLERPGDFLDLVNLELVAFLDVVVILERQAAFKPGLDLTHVVLEPL